MATGFFEKKEYPPKVIAMNEAVISLLAEGREITSLRVSEITERAVIDIMNFSVGKNIGGIGDDLADFAQLAAGDYCSCFVNYTQSSAYCILHLMNKTLENSV